MSVGFFRAPRYWLACFTLLYSAIAFSQPVEESTQAGVLAQRNADVAEEARQTAEEDKQLEQRIAARLSRVEGLQGVNVEVTAGLVTLQGLVEDEEQKAFAAQLIEKMDTVVAVNNRLQIDTAVKRRIAPILESGWDRAKRLIMTVPLLLIAGVVIWLAYLLGRLVTMWQRPFDRFRNPFLADLLRSFLRLGIFVAGVLVALNLLGATAVVSAVLGAAGIVGLAVGFAFRDLVENYIAGVLLSLRQPFAPNDHVVIEGHEGRVAALTSRATSLITLDGNHLRLPNALVFKGVILNYTRNPTRLFAFEVPLAQAADLTQVQNAAVQVLTATSGVLETPAPTALVANLSASGATITCSGWVDQREANFYRVQSEAMRRVRVVLDNAGALPDLVRKVVITDNRAKDADITGGNHAEDAAANGAIASSAAAGTCGDVKDVSAQVHIGDQLETERRSLAQQNLLREDAPRE